MPPAQEDNTAELNPPAIAGVEAVIELANKQLGKPYKIGTEGPDQFDCSGLMWFIFNQNKLGALIGGGRHRARWYAKWFQDAGNFVTDAARAGRGDLVFFGHPDAVTHVGIYLGGKRHRAISALTNPYGVTKHRIGGITTPVVGFGQVKY